MPTAALLASLMALTIASLFVVFYLSRSRLSRLGKVMYLDEGPATPTLRNYVAMVAGKPDAVVKRSWLRGGGLVPVELKSASRPSVPYPGHLLQLMAQGLLVEADTGVYPAYGFILYADGKPFKVRLGKRSRAYVLDLVDALHNGAAHPVEVPVDSRCGVCHARSVCGVFKASNVGS